MSAGNGGDVTKALDTWYAPAPKHTVLGKVLRNPVTAAINPTVLGPYVARGMQFDKRAGWMKRNENDTKRQADMANAYAAQAANARGLTGGAAASYQTGAVNNAIDAGEQRRIAQEQLYASQDAQMLAQIATLAGYAMGGFPAGQAVGAAGNQGANAIAPPPNAYQYGMPAQSPYLQVNPVQQPQPMMNTNVPRDAYGNPLFYGGY